MLAGVPLPETSAITSAEPAARERDEVVVVAAHLVAGAARRGQLEARDAAGDPLGSRLCWISRAICISRSWRSFSSRSRCSRTSRGRPGPGGPGSPRSRRPRSLKASAPGRSPTARRPSSRPRGSSGTTKAKSRARQRVAQALRRAGRPRARGLGSAASQRRRRRRTAARQRAGRGAPLVGEREARGRGEVERARDTIRWPISVVTTALDRLLVELAVSSRLMSNRFWSWKTFTDSSRLTRRSSSWIRPFSIGVAAQAPPRSEEGDALRRQKAAPVAARPEPEERDQPARLAHRAQQPRPACRRARPRPGPARRTTPRPRAAAAAPGARPRRPRAARRSKPDSPRAAEHAARRPAAPPSRSERRVQDLVAARGPARRGRRGRAARSARDIRFSERPARAPRAGTRRAPLVLLDDGDRQRASRASRVPAASPGSTRCCGARRRKVTESMILPIRCTPRPPVRRSLA